jgi:hypothetical protein
MRSNENVLKLICHFLEMMMTLKLMGLAFEVHDSGEASDNLDQKYRKIDPSLLDMFHYIFTHAGILTGKKDAIKIIGFELESV